MLLIALVLLRALSMSVLTRAVERDTVRPDR